MQGQFETYEIIKTQHNEPTQIMEKKKKKKHVNEQIKAQNSTKLFEAKMQIFVFKKNTLTLVQE